MKQTQKQGSNKGFIHLIIAIIVIILILTFLRLDLRSLVESETGQSNFGYVWELFLKLLAWLWGLIVGAISFIWVKIVSLFQYLTK